MFKKISAISVAVLLAASFTLSSFDGAIAQPGPGGPGGPGPRHGGGGGAAVAGGIALGILGAAAIAESERAHAREGCYRGPRECHWVEGGCWRDDDGNRVCRPGRRECSRPVICD
jgi:hypothetical protein